MSDVPANHMRENTPEPVPSGRSFLTWAAGASADALPALAVWNSSQAKAANPKKPIGLTATLPESEPSGARLPSEVRAGRARRQVRARDMARTDTERLQTECRAMTERQLLECFVTANDPDAFRVLIERHGPMVRAACRTVLRDQHDVEDAFQDTFLALARGAHTIKHRETIGPWLYRVALRRAQKARFKAARRQVHERNLTDPRAGYSTDPPDWSITPFLREEISRLPENHRLPVVLCYVEGKTCQEVAAKLRCPVGTIKERLWRARQTLRHRLSRRGLDAYSGR